MSQLIRNLLAPMANERPQPASTGGHSGASATARHGRYSARHPAPSHSASTQQNTSQQQYRTRRQCHDTRFNVGMLLRQKLVCYFGLFLIWCKTSNPVWQYLDNQPIAAQDKTPLNVIKGLIKILLGVSVSLTVRLVVLILDKLMQPALIKLKKICLSVYDYIRQRTWLMVLIGLWLAGVIFG